MYVYTWRVGGGTSYTCTPGDWGGKGRCHTHVHLETGEGRDVVIHMYTSVETGEGRDVVIHVCVHLETEEGRDVVIHVCTPGDGGGKGRCHTHVHLEAGEGRDVAIHMCTPGDGGGKGRCHTHVYTWRRGREGTLPYTCVHLETGEGRDVVSVASACVHPERGGVEVGVGASVIEIIYVDEGMEGGVVPVSQKYITYV